MSRKRANKDDRDFEVKMEKLLTICTITGLSLIIDKIKIKITAFTFIFFPIKI